MEGFDVEVGSATVVFSDVTVECAILMRFEVLVSSTLVVGSVVVIGCAALELSDVAVVFQ